MNNTKIEEFFNGFKLGELIHRKELSKEREENNKLAKALVIVSIIALVSIAIIFAIKFFKRRPIEEFEYDFDDDFDDTFSLEDEEADNSYLFEE